MAESVKGLVLKTDKKPWEDIPGINNLFSKDGGKDGKWDEKMREPLFKVNKWVDRYFKTGVIGVRQIKIALGDESNDFSPDELIVMSNHVRNIRSILKLLYK